MTTSNIQQLLGKIPELKKEIQKVIVGQDHVLDEILVALLAGGHCLLEGVPGLAKTLMVRTISQALHLSFRRIQFTPDLMPTDIIGTEILEEDHATGKRFFKFNKGPLFANMILADEINRTPPRTQSALLEAMNEGQVSVDGRTYPLDAPFLVMATQNAEERYGTYPLPESQMDRFLLRIRIDYPSPEDERRILLESPGRPEETLARIEPVLSVAEVRALQDAAERVHLSAELADYIVAVARETRRSPHLSLGLSPRGQLAWRNAARAAALAEGRDYVLPDDLKSLAGPVLAHRLVPASPVEALTRSRSDVERVLADIIDRLPAPG